jgi:hypothetical protein
MKGNNVEVHKIKLSHNQLPIHIVFEGQEGEKEYVLKTNKEYSKLLLNKKEY